MSRIVEAAEASLANAPPLNHVPRTKRGVLACAARDIGERLEAKALVAFTQSEDTAHRLARLHSHLPLLAFTPEPPVRNQLALVWGIEAFLAARVETTDAMVRLVDHTMLSIGRYQPGELVVILAGYPPGTVGSTNLIRVHRLGEEDLG
jgi:pyruvate kinase